MFNFESLNATRKWATSEKITTYIALRDLYAHDPKGIYRIDALYINTKSKYGDSPVIQCGSFGVSLPLHRLECVQKLINNEDAVKAINAGFCGFTVYEYQIGTGRYYSINFKNITPETQCSDLSSIDVPF